MIYMSERILQADKMYYAGGTVPKRSGPGGLVEADTLAAAMYAPTPKRVYRGGTFSQPGTAPVSEDVVDSEGRELFR